MHAATVCFRASRVANSGCFALAYEFPGMHFRSHATITFLVWALKLFSAGDLSAAAAANDRFSNRIILAGTNMTVTGSNTNAAKENNEPNHAGNPGGKSIWWSWSPPTNGDLTLNTDGSTDAEGTPLDTLLAVYTGASVSTLSVVASNDDHGILVTSRVRFQALAGTNYQIAVDGFNDGSEVAAGNIVLNLAFIGEPIQRPPNNDFTNGIVLSGRTVVTNSTNVLATREPGEPLHAGGVGDTSIWWSWTALVTTNVTVSTFGSSFDTLLAVYSGSVLTNLSLVAASDDTAPADGVNSSTLNFAASAGSIYQIAVDGFDGASGQVTLRIEPSRPPELGFPHWLPNGNLQFTITGLIGRRYEVDNSTNLSVWSPILSFVNTNGSFQFTDPLATNFVRQFYRAMEIH